MKCVNCGTEYESNFCPNCGSPNTQSQEQRLSRNMQIINAAASVENPYYAGVRQALDNNIYQEIEVREARITFSSLFLMLWGLMFGGIPLTMIVEMISRGDPISAPIFIFIFPICGFTAVGFSIYEIAKFLMMLRGGEETEGVVHSYESDNVKTNGRPYQICKILITDNDGKKKIIRYQLGSTAHPYSIGQRVVLARKGNLVRVRRVLEDDESIQSQNTIVTDFDSEFKRI